VEKRKMRRQDIPGAVKKVVLDVFENMYFMFPEAIAEGDPAPSVPESCFKASVAVKNNSGVLTLYCSEQLVADMANNLLGADQPISEADLIDVFKEAANVIAGNLVTALALDSDILLDVPVAEKLRTCSELRTAIGPGEVMFDCEGQFMKAGMVAPNE
jgi:hypothetical protein